MLMCSISTAYVCVVAPQVHPRGGFTQGHADPGGCVSDDLMIHPLQSDFIFFCAPDGPDANSLTGCIPLGAAAALCSRLPLRPCDTDDTKRNQCVGQAHHLQPGCIFLWFKYLSLEERRVSLEIFCISIILIGKILT